MTPAEARQTAHLHGISLAQGHYQVAAECNARLNAYLLELPAGDVRDAARDKLHSVASDAALGIREQEAEKRGEG